MPVNAAVWHETEGAVKNDFSQSFFDENDSFIHIRTHNTALKKRLLKYSRRYPAICQQTDADPETGCMEFEIAKGRFSFRLTAPYSEERRDAARRYARENNAVSRLE